MRIKNRIITILLTLLLTINPEVIFATSADLSYDEGYNAGYDAGDKNSGNNVKVDDILDDFYGTTKFRIIRDSISGFDYDGLDKGFYDGFKDGLKDNKKENYSKELGKLLGEIYGIKDYYEGKKLDYRRNLPSDRVICNEHSLYNDSYEYRKGFLKEYKTAFEESYNKAYRETNLKQNKSEGNDSFSNGQEIGKNSGELQATIDFMSNNTNNWQRNLPNEDFIILEYGQNLQTTNYRDGFIAGFYDGFSEGYNSKFEELAQGQSLNKSVSEIVTTSGTSLNSLDNVLNVFIEPGSFYHPVNLIIETIYDASLPMPDKLVKASDSYTISILNNSNNFDDSKPMKLSFKYYGDKIKGGIYKLVDKKWLYVPSFIEDEAIYTYVNIGSIKADGITYSVFLDNDIKIFSDSRGHWAKDEINTFVRRGIIDGYSDMTFKPDRSITRVEFLTILNKIYNLDTPYIKDISVKSNEPISYKEIESIMGRVLENSQFKWSDIAIDILHCRKVSSNSFNDMNNKITRAETVYMLYKFME